MILGEGEDRDTLAKLIKELGLEKDVDLHGFVKNPYKYIKRASVFVLSSRWEGFPNALVEALVLGVPVVSTDCPNGPREILEGGKWGHLVPVGNSLEMAEKILLAMNSCFLENRNSVSLYFRKKLNLNKIINKWLDLFE